MEYGINEVRVVAREMCKLYVVPTIDGYKRAYGSVLQLSYSLGRTAG